MSDFICEVCGDFDCSCEHTEEDFLFTCENCGKEDASVDDCQDPEEGHNGPTYMWCSSCYQKTLDLFAKNFSDPDDDY